MQRKAKIWIVAGVAAVAVLGTGAYALTNDYLGNNIEIEQVIPAGAAPAQTAAASAGSPAEASGSPSAAAGTVATGEQLNGEWSLTDASKVYFSVTTSRETVNFVNDVVGGSWTLNVDDLSQTAGSGQIDMASVDSGNGQRDGHVKGADYFNVEEFPEATFAATSFEGLPAEWTEGTAYDFNMTGTLSVRGIEKEVAFASKTVYQGGQLLLSGTTTVTFADFGMENPHNVVLDTENEIAVQLELVLDKA
ncbi:MULTISPECIES: YceI family protein [Cohnella]|uniref:YceI family protein n=1 Tax=Cohnella TaxID=329857 RepID=UPI0009B9678F|nr:YceI family protein [Cohnella massiliensis]MBN2981719.1 YceI family protein [Cohnella algarum]